MSVLKTTDLTKKFGKFTALNGVNIEVNKGEVFGFIGPNGAGKSTTIRVLLGILKATDGEAKIFGKDAWKDAVEIHKRIAYVPGDVNLWPNLTGGEVIDLFVELRGTNNKSRREELIKKFDLDPSKKCGTYSKGNRQKVALIAAFSSDADLYILDEPTSGLDPLMERVFQECVMSAKNEGKSILLSSHILSEVERLCDKVGIIRQGQIIETGTLDELRHLTRTSLLVETKQPIPALGNVNGVRDIVMKEQALSFQVDADELDNVMKYISQFGIVKLESAPPTLEDLFMRHYEEGVRKTSDSGAGGAL
ncbi:ABC transporter ATP-binding protein [Peribacillus frigoritolerans]|uniref:ABC transporter ATP-binding protein n=2 Tax=Peribacillus frigoritolerans TaxID=450367 RepID=UPI002079C86A|nr:ABC transporter ATP-binding protein [Peribacillus frigoritolerans]USK74469.1 ABC transporter ATP-binding protein [Peribacillus frigoritolerans]